MTSSIYSAAPCRTVASLPYGYILAGYGDNGAGISLFRCQSLSSSSSRTTTNSGNTTTTISNENDSSSNTPVVYELKEISEVPIDSTFFTSSSSSTGFSTPTAATWTQRHNSSVRKIISAWNPTGSNIDTMNTNRRNQLHQHDNFDTFFLTLHDNDNSIHLGQLDTENTKHRPVKGLKHIHSFYPSSSSALSSSSSSTFPILGNATIRNNRDRDRIVCVYSDIYGGLYSYDWESKKQTVVKPKGTGPELTSLFYSKYANDVLYAGGGQGIYMIDLRMATGTPSSTSSVTMVPHLVLPWVAGSSSTIPTNDVDYGTSSGNITKSNRNLLQYEVITHIASHPEAINETVIGGTDLGNLYRWDIRKLPYPVEQVLTKSSSPTNSAVTSLRLTSELVFTTHENGTVNSTLCKPVKGSISYFSSTPITGSSMNNGIENIEPYSVRNLYQSEACLQDSILVQPAGEVEYPTMNSNKNTSVIIVSASDNGMLELKSTVNHYQE